MRAQVIWLTSPECVDPRVVGPKAASLCRLARGGLPVPKGFVLPLAAQRPFAPGNRSQILNPTVLEAVTLLRDASPTSSIIVRSSAATEAAGTPSFAGMFLTVADVRSPDEFWHAINRILASASGAAVAEYSKLHALRPDGFVMNVLVQSQIPARSGGAARIRVSNANARKLSLFVEAVERHPAALLRGDSVALAAEIEVENSLITDLRVIEGSTARIGDEPFQQIAAMSESIVQQCGDDALIEWVSDGRDVYVLQARQLSTTAAPAAAAETRRNAPDDGSSGELLPLEHQVGLKGAAMLFFSSMGWFRKPLVYAFPNSTVAKLEDDMASVDFGADGITVRYSYGNEIGLPRFFAANVQEALKLVKESWDTRWFLIAHAYIDVRASFELYIDDDKFVLEHIPGVWESDNEETPDVLIRHHDRVEILRALHERRAKFLSPHGSRVVTVDPVTETALRAWAASIEEVSRQLRSALLRTQPLICHFVADRDGVWHFLNIRRTPVVAEQYTKKGSYFAVSRASDLTNWDGDSPILLQFSVDRGEERSIAEIARMLPRDKPVYVAFGLLSHPAMVLRELGITVVPAYLSHQLSHARP